MRRLTVVLIPFLLLGLVTSLIGCSCGGEATSPEGKEIEHFLKDKHVNAVLWEEWNIFDEYSVLVSTWNDTSLQGPLRLYNQRLAFKDRAAANHADIQSISPPVYLNEFWSKLKLAMYWFTEHLKAVESLSGSSYYNWMFERAADNNAQAWLALNNTCRQYNIKMEWPLPRTP